MRVSKLPAWPVAETRLREEQKGRPEGRAYDDGGEQGGHGNGGGRIMRLGLSN